MKSLPNILTIARLVLTVVVLLCLLGAANVAPFAGLDPGVRLELQGWAFAAFAVAAITDFFDGWLARKLNATSMLGAILDPIADKTLVAAAILGLAAGDLRNIALPGGLILFREFAVSALRETLAPKGLRLPVTVLAKWKTTLQLVALGALIFIPAWSLWGLPCEPGLQARALAWAAMLFWLAAAVTVWTGVEYALSARKALRG